MPEIDEATVTDVDRELVDALEKMVADYTTAMNAFEFHKALQAVWEVIGMLNRFIVTNAPWELANDPDQAGRLNTVLYFLAESLRFLPWCCVRLCRLPVRWLLPWEWRKSWPRRCWRRGPVG